MKIDKIRPINVIKQNLQQKKRGLISPFLCKTSVMSIIDTLVEAVFEVHSPHSTAR